MKSIKKILIFFLISCFLLTPSLAEEGQSKESDQNENQEDINNLADKVDGTTQIIDKADLIQTNIGGDSLKPKTNENPPDNPEEVKGEGNDSSSKEKNPNQPDPPEGPKAPDKKKEEPKLGEAPKKDADVMIKGVDSPKPVAKKTEGEKELKDIKKDLDTQVRDVRDLTTVTQKSLDSQANLPQKSKDAIKKDTEKIVNEYSKKIEEETNPEKKQELTDQAVEEVKKVVEKNLPKKEEQVSKKKGDKVSAGPVGDGKSSRGKTSSVSIIAVTGILLALMVALRSKKE